MDKHPVFPKRLVLETDDDCNSAYHVVIFFGEEGEAKELVIDKLCDAEAGYCLEESDSQIVVHAFEQFLLREEYPVEMIRLCAVGALGAFGIEPPAQIIQFPTRDELHEPTPSAA